ncbi:MAG: nuclear transport factor 2 family protein [Acidobacteriota bacterium]
MLSKSQAEAFAEDWIAAWNSHDLPRILSHYAEGVEFSSPFIPQIAGQPSGQLKGRSAVGDYWNRALARIPNLEFTLHQVLCGVRSLVIHYQRHDGRLASEWFEFGSDGLVVRSAAHYQE